MRHKYTRMGHASDVQNSFKTVYMDTRSPTITKGYPFKRDVILKNDLNDGIHYANDIAFRKVNKGLYQRVAKQGKSFVPIYGNNTDYIVVLPESHPGFNFDLFYIQYCTSYGILEHMYEEDDYRDIILYTFPEFVEASKD